MVVIKINRNYCCKFWLLMQSAIEKLHVPDDLDDENL